MYGWKSKPQSHKNQYQQAIDDFMQYLIVVGYTNRTQKMLRSYANEFLHWLEENGIKKLQDIEPHHIKEHYRYLNERPNKRSSGGLSSSSLSHHIYSIRLFLSYHQHRGTIEENPISSLNFPTPQISPRAIITKQEIKELYDACKNSREQAVLGLFYGCGLRRGEAEALNIKDIKFKEKLLYIREGKGRKRRVIPMTKQVVRDLKKYYHHERHNYIRTITQDNQYAFMLNKRGNRMKGERYYRLLKEIIQATEDQELIDKNISLHHLRHSIATHLLDNGVPVEQVRDFLGHEHLETTQIYTRVGNDQLSKS